MTTRLQTASATTSTSQADSSGEASVATTDSHHIRDLSVWQSCCRRTGLGCRTCVPACADSGGVIRVCPRFGHFFHRLQPHRSRQRMWSFWQVPEYRGPANLADVYRWVCVGPTIGDLPHPRQYALTVR